MRRRASGGSGAERYETGLSGRSNALDPGFHGVPAGPANLDYDADDTGVI